MENIYSKKDFQSNKATMKKDESAPTGADKLKKSFKAPAILIVVWTVIIILFGYSMWVDKTSENANKEFEDTIVSPTEKETTIASPPVNMTDEQRGQAQIRDTLRINDMKKLRSAIGLYFEDNENYPETFNVLVPNYLDEIPDNPFPGGQTYVYTGIGSKPFAYYEISYSLEVGTEGIGPGVHVASPDSVAMW